MFIRSSVAGKSLFYHKRSILVQSAATLNCAEQNNASRFGNLNTCSYIRIKKQFLDSYLVRLIFCDNTVHSLENHGKSDGNILVWRRSNNAVIDRSEFAAVFFHYAEPDSGISRIYSEDNHFLPSLSALKSNSLTKTGIFRVDALIFIRRLPSG